VSRLRTPISLLRSMPLRYRLPASFAAVALVTMLVLGGILIPLLGEHYARAENRYLSAGSQEAAQALSALNWTSVAAKASASGGTAGADTAAALRSVQLEALALQLRIQVFDPAGSLLVDSGPVGDIDASALGEDRSAAEAGGPAPSTSGGDNREPSNARRLPNPLGSGLFAGDDGETGARSGRTAAADLSSGNQVVAKLVLSEGPAYGATVLHTTLLAWVLAGLAAVILAALLGWLVSRRLTRPLLAITAASDSMARGDLRVRAPVDRADEIGRLAGSFNAMAHTTEKTVETLRRFVADAAHELGTPLTALRADLELAQEESNEPSLQRLLQRALRHTERIQHLSSDLLRLSRLDRGALPTPVRTVNIVPLLRQSAEEIASRADQAGLELTLDLPDTPVAVLADAAALRGAVGNLLDNAIKFTPAGGSVVMGAYTEDHAAVIWVQDTGIGIPTADLGNLFSRFHRSRNAASYPGSGLGLAIVRATVELHGGEVSVSTAPSGGSRFELRLPAT
jgi:signal transduction histidine kinase